MSTKGSSITMKFKGVVDVVRASRFKSSYVGLQIQRNIPIVSQARLESSYWMQHSLQFFSTKNNTSTNANRLKKDEVQPEAPASISTFSSWFKWALCSLLSLVLPFLRYNWRKLQRIEEAVVVVEEVEKVAEVVEKVAEVAEKVSEDVAEMLPEDGKLKKVALVVENASEQAAHGAKLTEDFIHKVEEVTNDMEDLESFVEPIIDKIVKKETTKN
ncbi:uncharacterized protein [Cicer arietinum]|uniref:Uncharacterized protein LOC101505572 isoform X2 n=1 Tax=Cicer arietinum TaxID=3827 RepID=A0A1S2YHC2_CICAR|nr:uncharacterized protein LOC101505572 isoform X2 [Cicer arietinum]